VALLY